MRAVLHLICPSFHSERDRGASAKTTMKNWIVGSGTKLLHGSVPHCAPCVVKGDLVCHIGINLTLECINYSGY